MLIDVPKQKNHQTESKQKEAVLAAEPKLCATLAMRRWLRMSGLKSGPLFVSVKNGDRLTGQRIAGQTINRIVRSAAEAAGLSEMNFTAHSRSETSRPRLGFSERQVSLTYTPHPLRPHAPSAKPAPARRDSPVIAGLGPGTPDASP